MANSTTLRMSFAIFVVLIVSTVGVFALGVSTPYAWEAGPIEMEPGETMEVFLTLVNGDDRVEEAEVKIVEGNNIAQITSGSSYSVNPKTADTKVSVTLSVPSDASIGTNYNVRFSISEVSQAGGGGTVELGVGYNIDLGIKIVSETAREVQEQTTSGEQKVQFFGTATIIVIIIVIILVIILLVLFLKRKNRIDLNNENSM